MKTSWESGIEFVRSTWEVNGIAMALIMGGGLMFASVLQGWMQMSAVRDEIATIEHRIAERKKANEREALRIKRLSPEDRRIEKALAEQTMSVSGSGLLAIDLIEQAWAPDIALKSIVVDRAGQQGRLEGGAPSLAHVYIFMDRLRANHPDRKVALLQHHFKVEDERKIHHFALSIEHP